MQPAAVILAGGEGSRLGGVVKATIEIGGLRLIDRLAAALRPSAAPILVAHGRIEPVRLGLSPDMVAVPDLESDQRGPIAGLAAAVAWLQVYEPGAEFVVSAAVDTPFFPAEFVSRVAGLAAGTDTAAVVACCGGQDYPTNALWRLAALRDLPREVIAGTAPKSLKRLAEALGAHRLEWPEQPDGDPFANVNTPEDLLVLCERAAGGESPR